MTLSHTVGGWAKHLGKVMNEPASPYERMRNRANRPARKAAKRADKMLRKMKAASKPNYSPNSAKGLMEEKIEHDTTYE